MPDSMPTCRCAIAQRSYDGFGHQLEAKLTCIAAAHSLGLDYVHVPFSGRAHGEDPTEAEAHMGFSRAYQVFRNKLHVFALRRPDAAATWPFSRPCRYCLNR